MTTPLTWEQEVSLAKEAFEHFRLLPQGFGPMLRLSGGPDGDEIAILEGAETTVEKAKGVMGAILLAQASQCVFMSDAWVKSFDTKVEAARQDKAPSDYEDKTEALIVWRATADKVECEMFPYTIEGQRIVWGERIIQGEYISEITDAAQFTIQFIRDAKAAAS